MSDNPCVSILIPAYNAEGFIARSMACALSQTHGNVEVIVVDDGSSDATAAKVEAFASKDGRVKLIRHASNRGRLEARRTGIEAAGGEFTLFLDADDEMPKTMVERMLAEQERLFDIVQCDFEVRYDNYVTSDEVRFNRDFNRPPATQAFGDDITHLVFRERRTTWSLCGKLMRTHIVKDAIAHIGASSLTQAEDACLFFIISCLAQSYKGVPDFAGYLYNIDAGGSDARWKSMNLEQFGYTCRYVESMDLIESFLRESGRMQALEADLRTVRAEHARAVADKLIRIVEPADKPAAYAEFVKRWPVREAVAAMSEAGWGRSSHCMQGIAGSSALACPPRQVRTVAAFNYRMHIGGAERVAATLVREWLASGLNVVFFAEEPRKNCAYELPDDVVWIELPPAESCGWDGYAQRAEIIERAVREFGIDAFVHHQWWSDLIGWDMMLLKTLGVPFCIFCHNLFEVLFFEADEGDFECTRLFRYADALVVLSQADEQFWSSKNPRVRKTCNPATVEPNPNRLARLDRNHVVWVGRLTSKDKQPEEALHIMARAMAHDPKLTFTMVGASEDHSAERHLHKLARKLGIEDRTEFIGAVDDVVPYYLQASTLLLTSRYESWCLVLAEAGALGVPCVMYDLPYLTLAEGRKGIVPVPQGDRDAAARAVIELARDKERREELGGQAFAHMQEISAFDQGKFWNELFDELGEGSPSREALAQEDAQWDLVLDGLKESVRKAKNPSIGSFAKRKGYEAARAVWHHIRR